MYQFSGKAKMFSYILIIVGVLGIGWGFVTAPSTEKEAKEYIASHAAHGDGHGDATHVTTGDEHHDAKEDNHTAASHDESDHHQAGHDDEHVTHVLHQLQNRPWASVYVALLFFLGISLLVLAFYAAQRVAQSGWSVVLFRVMEAITANIVPTSIVMLLMLIACVMHYNHLFVWMADGVFTPGNEN